MPKKKEQSAEKGFFSKSDLTLLALPEEDEGEMGDGNIIPGLSWRLQHPYAGARSRSAFESSTNYKHPHP